MELTSCFVLRFLVLISLTQAQLDNYSKTEDLKNLTTFVTENSVSLLIPPYRQNKTVLNGYSSVLHGIIHHDPVKVCAQVAIESISELDELNHEMSMSFILNLGWNDTRLANNDRHNSLAVPEHLTHLIWKPDTTIQSSKKTTTTVDNHVMRLGKHGGINYSTKMSTTVTCKFSLKTFPFDRQTCSLSLYSFSHYNDELLLFWDEYPNMFYEHSIDTLTSFYLEHYTTSVRNIAFCSINGTKCRSKSFLTMEFEYKRYSTTILVSLYLPAALLVLLGILPTLMEPRSTSTRIGIAGILILTFCILIHGQEKQIPDVSYLTASEIYLGVCFFFMILTLVEIVILNHVFEVLPLSKVASEQKIDEIELDLIDSESFTGTGEKTDAGRVKQFQRQLNVDKKFRIIYITIFVCFNVVYWILILLDLWILADL